ncbi:GtrA family protein, partial [Candidatus Parcubacteria bacterium]|nr:GtrA family protein [Candidatus Parcubacteria bacterium]
GIDVVLFNVLTAYFGVYYLASATFAMTISFIARFLLQKHVTFEDQDKEHEKKQFAAYSVLYVASLGATNVLLVFFIERLHINSTLSQIASILLVASVCYFVYKLFIFTKKS